MPTDNVVDFYCCYERVTGRAHQWGLCAAAYVIWGHISDDSFSDFKAGLVGLGSSWFGPAVADADALADHPMVQEIAAGRVDRFVLAAEEIHYAAVSAFEQRTDGADGFWKALETRSHSVADEQESQTRVRWSGRFGDAADRVQIPLRLPRLVALFSERPLGDS